MTEATQQCDCSSQTSARKPTQTAKRHAALRGFVSSYLDVPRRDEDVGAASDAGKSRHRKVIVWRRESNASAASWQTLAAD